MKPERWQQISRIFESALPLDAEERAVYLREQCGTDEALRQDVEDLIASHRNAAAEGFIDSPAVEGIAPLLAGAGTEKENVRLREGQSLGSYLVLERLGAGGMGEVYLAKDTRLDRKVALKILPEDVAADKRRMQRFAQEAKVASALNQPNIMTVFEFGEADSLHFLATEYIDGKTLRQHLRGGQLKLTEILDISAQIVAALEAAHEAKIVHRDIKPENVMIRRRDHIVKVLDFGLAKLTERNVSLESGETATEAPTEFKTAPGSVLGTVAYMSPEQSQGLPVDERGDLWSTGVVIYEMVTGRLPFRGPTSSHTVVEIIEKEAPSLSQSAKLKVPDELERIVRKALAKDRAERYQTASDMLIDLRSLRKRMDYESEIERSAAPGFTELTSAELGSRKTDQRQEQTPGAKSRRKIVVGALLLVVLILAAVYGYREWLKSPESVASSTSPAATGNLPERYLSYWMTVQKYRDGKPFENPFRLAGEINFERDYHVRLHVRAPQPGYLYILNESPAADEPLQILFPSPTSNNGSAVIAELREIQIPEQSWFKFDAEQGTETLWLIWSDNAVDRIEAAKTFANPSDRGVINDPVLSQSLKSFLNKGRAEALTVEKKGNPPETLLRSPGTLVHPIKLAHN